MKKLLQKIDKSAFSLVKWGGNYLFINVLRFSCESAN